MLNDIKIIGGYFGLELGLHNEIHKDGVWVNSGRNALELILMSINDVKRIWIPYFTCNVILEPIIKLEIPYSYYHINARLEIADEIQLNNGEFILLTNYFGIKDQYINEAIVKYNNQVIVDCCQSLLYIPSEKGVRAFYSPRKFVGIPDGGIAFIAEKDNHIDGYEQDVSYDRMSHLLQRVDLDAEKGYAEFKINSAGLSNQPIKKISKLSKALCDHIDFDHVFKLRNRNFNYLHEYLGNTNKLKISSFGINACPMVYPFMCDNVNLRNHLIKNKIFVAKYWPNVLQICEQDFLEFYLVNNVLPLPIDQRYDKKDMRRIVDIITELIEL